MLGQTGFTQSRIDFALEEFRAFLDGRRRTPLVTVHAPPDYRQETDAETMVAKACAQIQADGRSAEPFVLPTFWADFGTISTAALWGGRKIPAQDGGGVHIEPAVANLDQLATLTVRQSFEESDFQRGIDLYRRICERLETDQIYVRQPDFQGPMNTLALVLDQTELMCGMFEDPEGIGQALDQVTDTLLAYVGRFRAEIGPAKVIGSIWPYNVLPDGNGISITQDYMPLLGPEQYQQFELPRLKRLADAFGGVFIHCCGSYAQHLPALAGTDFKIWGLETHHPFTKVWDVQTVFGDRLFYTPYVNETARAEFPSLCEFVEHLASRPDSRAERYWFCLCDGWCDTARLRQIIDRHWR